MWSVKLLSLLLPDGEITFHQEMFVYYIVFCTLIFHRLDSGPHESRDGSVLLTVVTQVFRWGLINASLMEIVC